MPSSPGEIELRRATVEDAPLLCVLNRDVQRLHAARAPELFKPFQDEQSALGFFRDLLAQQRNHFALAFLHSPADPGAASESADAEVEPAGYVWWSVERRQETLFRYAVARLYVHHIAVDAEYRRRGVGTALLQTAIARARELSLAGVVLDTWGFNVDAQAFFLDQGFDLARIELVHPLR